MNFQKAKSDVLSTDSVSLNAIKFLKDMDPYSVIMTTDLFHHDACVEIDKEHNPSKKIHDLHE